MNKYITLFCICLFSVIKTEDYYSHWVSFKGKYGRKYSSESEDYTKFATFVENILKIREHNKEGNGYTLKINNFADYTHEEYIEYLKRSFGKGKPKEVHNYKDIPEIKKVLDEEDVPKEVDWRKVGNVVSPVKDQGQCGSCYAFGATGAAESNWVLKGKEQILFSEQQIIDCSYKYGNLGCNGGLQEYVYDYAKVYGFMEGRDYPYLAYTQRCLYDEKLVKAYVNFYYGLEEGNEDMLAKGLAKIGPLTIAIDASDWSFQFYESGVYYSKRCGNSPWDLDHAVLAVGYGTEEKTGLDYFIVKNSWGDDWGLNGYILMSRNRDNNCGVATDVIGVVLE